MSRRKDLVRHKISFRRRVLHLHNLPVRASSVLCMQRERRTTAKRRCRGSVPKLRFHRALGVFYSKPYILPPTCLHKIFSCRGARQLHLAFFRLCCGIFSYATLRKHPCPASLQQYTSLSAPSFRRPRLTERSVPFRCRCSFAAALLSSRFRRAYAHVKSDSHSASSLATLSPFVKREAYVNLLRVSPLRN